MSNAETTTPELAPGGAEAAAFEATPAEAPVAQEKQQPASEKGQEGKILNKLKLFVYNLPEFDNKHDLKKLMNKHRIEHSNTQKRPVKRVKYGFVTFATEETRLKAEEEIPNIIYKGKKLRTGPVYTAFANESKRAECRRKRGEYEEDRGVEEGDKRQKTDTATPIDVRDKTMPLWQMTYEKQLEQKKESMANVLKSIKRKSRKELMKQYRKDERNGGRSAWDRLPSWIKANDSSLEGRCCAYGGIKPSPVLEGYRNKCEFTVGKNHQGGVVVGFRVGSFAQNLLVEKPDKCTFVPELSLAMCTSFNAFICKSPFGPYDSIGHGGLWRQITVKCSTRLEEVMVVVQVNVDTLNPPAGWAEELDRLKQWFQNGPTAWKSLYLQYYTGVSFPGANDPVEFVMGSPTITEKLLRLNFNVSPNSFFQVNTPGAETLFTVVSDYCVSILDTQGGNELAREPDGSSDTIKDDGTVTLVDVCCGTGTIGLCIVDRLGEKVNKLVGIEMCESAVEDAKLNASRNGMADATFIASKAESVLGNMLREMTGNGARKESKIVAIVDPPRAGLHNDVIQALRTCAAIDSLVYVSCNPTKSFVEDVHRLCLPHSKRSKGQPFVPIHSTAVDMFPHTEHCEIVMHLRRHGPKSKTVKDVVAAESTTTDVV